MKKVITIIAVTTILFVISPVIVKASTSGNDFVCDKVAADGDLIKCQLRLFHTGNTMKYKNIKGTFINNPLFQLDHIDKSAYIKNINSDGYTFNYDLSDETYINNDAIFTAYFKVNLNGTYDKYSSNISVSYQTTSLFENAINGNIITSNSYDNETIVFDEYQENKLSSLSIDGHNLNPTFDPNTTYYEVVTKNDSIILNASLKSNKSQANINLTNNKIPLNNGANEINITVSSANKNKRVYTIVITRENQISNNISSNLLLRTLTIAGNNVELTPGTYTYNITVPYETKKAAIDYTTNDTNTKVEVEGDNNLKKGLNTYTLKLTDTNGNNTNYVLVVNREEKVLSNDSSIKSIGIKDIVFEFDENKLNYNLKIPYLKNSLDFNITLNDANAKYEILNNNNLKDQSTITIKVTAEDKTTTDYKIKIEKEFPYLVVIVVTISILLLLLIIILIKRHKQRREIEYTQKIV